jgi:hypothetical protein
MRFVKTLAMALVLAGVVSGCFGEQRAASLKVGDCFDDTEEMFSDEEIFRVPSVPCSQPHDNEVFHVARYSGSTYSLPDIEEFADLACYGAFSPYVGRSYETSVIDFTWFIPTPSSWARGDREVTCIAYHMDLEKLQSSVRGSGR